MKLTPGKLYCVIKPFVLVNWDLYHSIKDDRGAPISIKTTYCKTKMVGDVIMFLEIGDNDLDLIFLDNNRKTTSRNPTVDHNPQNYLEEIQL